MNFRLRRPHASREDQCGICILFKFVTLTIVLLSRAYISFVLLGFSLVMFYWDFIGSEKHFLPDKIEHLSPLYAVASFNSRQ